MIVDGTTLTLQILLPTRNSPDTIPVTVPITPTSVEISDSSFTDINGDQLKVVAAEFDVTGAVLSYTVIDPKADVFDDVDIATGFNGFALSFGGLVTGSATTINSVDLIAAQNTLAIPKANVFFFGNTIFVNVDALPYANGLGLGIAIGFRINGTGGVDRLTGDVCKDPSFGLPGADRLDGQGGDDQLFGAGADRIRGGAGADSPDGGDGNDTLAGGLGDDLNNGGAGDDLLLDFRIGTMSWISRRFRPYSRKLSSQPMSKT